MSYAIRSDGLGWRSINGREDLLDGETFSETQPAALSLPSTISVTPWQFRKALNQTGLRSAVESAIAQADQDTKDGYEFATEFREDDPVVATMAQAVGKSAAEIRAFFELAETL